jgi:phenylacetate-CoA ligase
MPDDLCPEADPVAGAALLDTFQAVVARMPWYRTLLAEAGVSPHEIASAEDIVRRCPRLSKQNTFERFRLQDLAAGTPLPALASVLTSSGHGGRFSFGLATRGQDAAAAEAIDHALDAAFAVRTRPTLAVNCLPMGVTFASRCMTVATTSVREDMALALIEAFGPAYAQVLLVADPLFLKRLTDVAARQGFDWHRHRMQVVVGEEVFGEHFRTCMAQHLGLALDDPEGGWLMSSMGVGELGLHLCYETRATVALRRRLATHAGCAQALLGPASALQGTPMCFTYDTRRIHVEVDRPDPDGFGRLLVSMLDPDLPVPLLRYETGDVGRLVAPRAVQALLDAHGLEGAHDLPSPLLLLRGRARERLPNGAHVGVYKDAIYADASVARHLTGAVRLTADGSALTMHVQLVPDAAPPPNLRAVVDAALPEAARPAAVEVWPYAAFPFGMTLDYERKFVSWLP